MIVALLRAFADLSARPLRGVVVLGLGLAAASFIALWVGVGIFLTRTRLFDWAPLDWVAGTLGAAAVLVLSWLLFPAVVTIVMGLFLDRIAAAVEALHYPGLGPPRRPPVSETVAATLRLMGLALFLNLLALPIYLFVPGVNFFVFLGLNGYLFGREYFEVVALRRLDAAACRGIRSRFFVRVFVAGVVIAALFAVPVVNLVAPVVATAFMLHIFQALPRAAPLAPT